MTSMIVIDNVCFEYPDKRVLHNVSFSVNAGSITALVGPNGAGKTTLLRCMAALDEPFSGNIYIDGVDAFKESRETHKKLGYLSDFFGLYSELTIEQSLWFAAAIHKLPSQEIRARVGWASHLLGLNEKLHDKNSSLSRGWRQRVGVAQAIIHKPKLLLLDEPASGLDPEARIELSKLFKKLRDQGMTLIVSSHILAELEDYCTDMLVLRDGRITGHQPSTHHSASMNIKIVFLSNADALQATLNEISNVSGITLIDQNNISFDFDGNDHERVALLKVLLDKNFPITDFYVQQQNLQHIYMNMSKGDY